MASPLETLQRRFVRCATFLPDPAFLGAVAGGGKLSAGEAVDVYACGYVARLTESLGETYEACWRVLGDEDFFKVAESYIRRYPSSTHNLSDYGASMPDFLRGQACSLQLLGDLAAYEWEFKELFHAPPHQGLSAAALAEKTRPDSRFVFGSALRLLSLDHRIYAIWKRDRSDDTPLEPSQWEGTQRLALYKKEGNPIFVRELTVGEYAALRSLSAGNKLDEALAAAPEMEPAAAQALFAFIAEAQLVMDVL